MTRRSGFDLAGDILWVHGEHSSSKDKHRGTGGRSTAYTTLPSAAFMLAFAAGEAAVIAASKRMGVLTKTGYPMGLGSAGLVEAWAPHVDLLGRMRIAASGSSGFAPWKIFDGADLQTYLNDAVAMRNRLAHVGTVKGIKLKNLKTRYFIKTYPDGTVAAPSMTLMLAEGFLIAAQDICYLVATPQEQQGWDHVVPIWSKAGPPLYIARDPRLPPIR